MGFMNWAKRLDDRAIEPLERRQPAWRRSALFRFGMSTVIIFGGGFLIRAFDVGRLHTGHWALVVYGVAGGVGLLMVLAAYLRRDRSTGPPSS